MNKTQSIIKACKITDSIFGQIIRNFSLFKTEKDIERFFNMQCREFGVKRAFPPIIAIGKNAVEIHHKPKNTRLVSGFCVIDMGVRVDGYCSDMTRTICIGNPTATERKLYSLVLQCQQKSIQKLRAGANCADIDVYARTLLGEYKKYFIHSLGHGVTRKIHDKPFLKPTSQEMIRRGDIVTVEPGIYIPRTLGIRIEDTILVQKDKITILTQTPKGLLVIQK